MDDIVEIILADEVPARGSPTRAELLQLADELLVPIPHRARKDDIVRILQAALVAEEGEYKFCRRTPSGRMRFYYHKPGKVTPIRASEIDYNSECFKLIPKCPKKCKKFINPKYYPCRRKRTVFDNRADYLAYHDLRRNRREIAPYDKADLQEHLEEISPVASVSRNAEESPRVVRFMGPG